jgi:hypothetical protein
MEIRTSMARAMGETRVQSEFHRVQSTIQAFLPSKLTKNDGAGFLELSRLGGLTGRVS